MVYLNPRALALRQMPGLATLLCTMAFALPIWLWIAMAHRDHWTGSALGDYWTSFAMPMGCRMWSALAALTLVGWVSCAGREHPRTGPALFQGLVRVSVGLIGISLCALPSWVWCLELGILEYEDALAMLFSVLVVPLAAGICASSGTVLMTSTAGALFGVAGACSTFWLVWGAFI